MISSFIEANKSTPFQVEPDQIQNLKDDFEECSEVGKTKALGFMKRLVSLMKSPGLQTCCIELESRLGELSISESKPVSAPITDRNLESVNVSEDKVTSLLTT